METSEMERLSNKDTVLPVQVSTLFDVRRKLGFLTHTFNLGFLGHTKVLFLKNVKRKLASHKKAFFSNDKDRILLIMF